MMSNFTKMMARRAMPLVRTAFSTVAAALPESVVVLEYKYGPRMLQRREPYHAGHLFLVREMIQQGSCLAGGPVTQHQDYSYDGSGGRLSTEGYDGMGGAEPMGAFFWFTTIDAANEFLRKDPYALADLVTNYAIYDWNVAVSK